MIKKTNLFLLICLSISLLIISCQQAETSESKALPPPSTTKADEAVVRSTLTTLLTAIENRDLPTLESVLSPSGEMQLIIPERKISNTVTSFVDLHREWFKDTIWTIETNILNIKVGEKMAMATTDAMYREPERNGKPYFNHIIVSYVLEKQNGKWYVIKDHACTLEKTK